MPGKEIKLIGKTIHPDGYYTTSSISTSHDEASESKAASTVPIKRPHIKLWFRLDKGIFIGPEQREKLNREEEELQAAKEEIPTLLGLTAQRTGKNKMINRRNNKDKHTQIKNT